MQRLPNPTHIPPNFTISHFEIHRGIAIRDVQLDAVPRSTATNKSGFPDSQSRLAHDQLAQGGVFAVGATGGGGGATGAGAATQAGTAAGAA